MNVKQVSHKNMNKRRDSQLVIIGFYCSPLRFLKVEFGANYSNFVDVSVHCAVKMAITHIETRKKKNSIT